MMKWHELKTWPDSFKAVKLGRKTHEVRRNDRDFQVGDVLVLKEYIPEESTYTRDEIAVEVTYISKGGSFDLPPEMCVMSIRELKQDD